MRFPQAGVILGGYEQEEQNPHPFVAIDLEQKEDVEQAALWLFDLRESKGVLRLVIDHSDDGELAVSLNQDGAAVAAGEVWRDESWEIFSSFLEQGGAVWVMISRNGVVLPSPYHPIAEKYLEVRVNG